MYKMSNVFTCPCSITVSSISYISVLPLKFKHSKQPEHETVFRVQLQNANRKEMHGRILFKHGLIQATQVKSEQIVNPNAKGSISVIA